MDTTSGIPQFREAFRDDGFVLATEAIADPATLEAARAGACDVLAGRYRNGVPFDLMPKRAPGGEASVQKVEMPHVADDRLRAVVTSPRLGALAAELFDAQEVYLWWVQLIAKPPLNAEDSRVGWHQDGFYWGPWSADSEVFTAWVPLTPSDPEAGGLRYAKASHRLGLVTGSDFIRQDDDRHLDELLGSGAAARAVDVRLAPGQVSFHHKHTFHASGPNRRGELRLALGIHLRTHRSAPSGARRGSTVFYDDDVYGPRIYARD